MSPILLLTVGSGTAGRESNIAEGLMTSVRLVAPYVYALLPSAAEVSLAVAEMIEEGLRGQFPCQPASPVEPFFTIPDADSLTASQEVVEKAIAALRAVFPGCPVVVNATSGTKQMTAGATLAALQARVARIDFTSGERRDGVVRTGHERILSLDPAHFHRRRAREDVEQLAASGALASARSLWRHYAEPRDLLDHLLETLEAWQAFDYPRAATCSGKLTSETWRRLRQYLQQLRQAIDLTDPAQANRLLADRWAALQRASHYGNPIDTLLRVGQLIEFAAQCGFAAYFRLVPPYQPNEVLPLLPANAIDRYRSHIQNGELHLGLYQLMDILRIHGQGIGQDYFNQSDLKNLVEARNRFVHTAAPIPHPILDAGLPALNHLLQQHFPNAAQQLPHIPWPTFPLVPDT